MVGNALTPIEWANLYELMSHIKDLAPWDWMEETDVFGVQSPETQEIGYVSIMGQIGEHYGISVYLGAKGLYQFWDLEASPSEEKILEIHQLQATWEDREYLTKPDLDIIKQLGLKFRGHDAWPQFRSILPGHMPWYLEADEAHFLVHVLEQILEVAPRSKYNHRKFETRDEKDGFSPKEYLIRVAHQQAETLIWEDKIMSVAMPEPEYIPISVDSSTIASLRRLPKRDKTFEIDVIFLFSPISDGGGRPYFPYALLVVDGETGMILDIEMIYPTSGMVVMWSQVPQSVANILLKGKGIPMRIKVHPGLMAQLLKPLAESINCKIKETPQLVNLNRVKKDLAQQMMQNGF